MLISSFWPAGILQITVLMLAINLNIKTKCFNFIETDTWYFWHNLKKVLCQGFKIVKFYCALEREESLARYHTVP